MNASLETAPPVTQPPPRRLSRAWIAGGAAVLIVALAATAWFTRAGWQPKNPLIVTPVLAVEALSGHSIYYDGPARSWLLQRHPELLRAEDRQDTSARVHSFIQAVQNPKLFRQLDRQYRFDTLLLVGDPSEYQPLLDHLLDSKDWTLSYLDHTSVIFKRDGAEPWTEAKLQAVRARFDTASAHDRAVFLAQAAVKLIALRKAAEGKKLAEEAAKVDPGAPEAWSALAEYFLNRGEWNPAIANANRALEIDSEFPRALASKAQALYATKHFSDAFHVSEKLIELMPNDPAILFYYAKICHEDHAFEEEIKTLLKLIVLAEQNDRTSSGYRIYLGQAYARDGQGPEALDQYRQALGDPDLTESQQKEVVDAMKVIKSHIKQQEAQQ
jgi:tetratricopeptide (TPR) repeat protein